MFCTKCGGAVDGEDRYCGRCGAAVAPPTSGPALSMQGVPFQAAALQVVPAQAGAGQVGAGQVGPGMQMPSGSGQQGHHSAVTKGFAQTFGLDPRVAFVTLIVDLMLNAGEVASLGVLVPASIAAGAVVGYVAYKAQMKWYGDDSESAKIKALILGLLTAIPTPLPALLYVPSGLVGLYHKFRKK